MIDLSLLGLALLVGALVAAWQDASHAVWLQEQRRQHQAWRDRQADTATQYAQIAAEMQRLVEDPATPTAKRINAREWLRQRADGFFP